MRIARIIIYFLIGVLLAQCVYYYPSLPEKMASHFDAAGNADGWMSKSSFFIFEAVILLLIMAEFTLVPYIIKMSPRSMINLPNKDFWLAAERREETFAIIKTYFEWFSILLLMLFIAVNQIVFQANIAKQNLSPTAIWLVLGVFFALVIYWLVKFIGRFRMKNL